MDYYSFISLCHVLIMQYSRGGRDGLLFLHISVSCTNNAVFPRWKGMDYYSFISLCHVLIMQYSGGGRDGIQEVSVYSLQPLQSALPSSRHITDSVVLLSA